MNTDTQATAIGMKRKTYLRPVSVAVTFTFVGEMLILYIWGVELFAGGQFWRKFVWTATCGVAMGAVIGAMVNIFVTERIMGRAAAIGAGAIYFLTLTYCVFLCFEIDRVTGGTFGAHTAPEFFIAGGLAPAFVSAFAYAWLLYSRRGQSLLDHIRY